MPDIIRSSMLIHDKKRDFSVLIKMPSIEYSILAKNFTFLKTLTRFEIQEYLDCGFQCWEDLLLKHCMQYRKFNELLRLKVTSFGLFKPPMGRVLNPFKEQ